MITDNFLKMCKQAEEIQKVWKPKVGDWQFWCNNKTLCANISIITSLQKKYSEATHRVWLPTLEQLFEMAHKVRDKEAYHKSKEYEIIADFIEWMLNSDIDKYKDFKLDFNDTKSCLLIYIMEEFYHKIWTGEKWEAIT